MLLAEALVDAEVVMDSTLDLENSHILPEIPLHIAEQVSVIVSKQKPV